MAYATGKYANAICDRCGFKYPYLSMKTEWDHTRVCHECYEPKHPQLDPSHPPVDAEALWQPRPDVSLPQAQLGRVTTRNPSDSVIVVKGTNMMRFRDDPNIGSAFSGAIGQTSLGLLEISVDQETSPNTTSELSGLAGTGSIDSLTTSVSDSIATPTGLAGTGTLGSLTVTGASSLTSYTVTVASYSGANYFYIDGSRAATLNLSEGSAYRFDQSDNSNSNHPLRISITSDGTHGGGSAYTTGVTTSGTPGSSGAYTQITVASGAPTLYYYCTNHSGMGGQINT